MGLNLGRQSLNQTRDYGLKVSAPDNTTLAGRFSGDETFAARLWLGDDSATEIAVAAGWAEGSPGSLASPVVKLTVSADAIADAVPGVYYVEVVIDPGTHDIHVLPDGSTLELVASEPAATTAATIPSLADVRRVAPWLEGLVRKHPSLDANLLDYRLAATRWVYDTLRARARSAWARPADGAPWYAGIVPRLDAPNYGDAITGVDTSLADRLDELETALDADGLVVSADVTRAAAFYAVAEALRATYPAEGKEAGGYAGAHRTFLARANAILGATTLRVTDTDSDFDAEFRP